MQIVIVIVISNVGQIIVVLDPLMTVALTLQKVNISNFDLLSSTL